MTSKNLHFSERGFGNEFKGKSHVLAGPNGEALPLRVEIFKLPKPNGSIGGGLIVVPLSKKERGSRSHINSHETVYDIFVDRTKNFSNIEIRQIDANDLDIRIYQTAFMPGPNGTNRFVTSDGMQNSETAVELATGILSDAVNKAIERSYDPAPQGLYYGKIAFDTQPIQRELFVKNKDLVIV